MSDIQDFNPGVYWLVGGKRYNRKADAVIASSHNKLDITFNYFNDEFSQFDWLEEPDESFEELAIQRAHQLRDSHKYLRLWYSGGADSHTTLQAFLRANIYIDEIVMVRTSPIDDFDSEACRETNLRSIPYIKSIQHIIPKTKISFVNITAKQYLAHYKSPDWQMETTVYDFPGYDGITETQFAFNISSVDSVESVYFSVGCYGDPPLTGGELPNFSSETMDVFQIMTGGSVAVHLKIELTSGLLKASSDFAPAQSINQRYNRIKQIAEQLFGPGDTN